MKLPFAVALTCALFLTGCQEPNTQRPVIVPGTPYQLNNTETAAIFDGVYDKLKDPFSSRIRGINAAKEANGVVSACGFVNAKNSFGAYTGDVPFVGVVAKNMRGETVFVVVKIGQSVTEQLAVMRLCQQKGISI